MMLSNHICYHAKFGRSRSNGTIIITEILQKNLTIDDSRSLKVTGTDTDRSATYDFLLVIRDNHMGLSCTVSEINGDFCRKSQIFNPCILGRHRDCSSLNFITAVAVKN